MRNTHDGFHLTRIAKISNPVVEVGIAKITLLKNKIPTSLRVSLVVSFALLLGQIDYRKNLNILLLLMKRAKTKKITKTMPKIIPLGSRVLIRPFTKEELTKKNRFGILLPDSGSKDKSEQGLVLAVGPGDYQDGKLVPIRVKIGDKVAFSKYGFEEVTSDGEELYLIKEENILAVLK